MIYTEMTKKALQLCFQAHKNQVDRSGMPYVFHPFHLAEQMNEEAAAITALLHDVAEDTDYTLQDIRNMGFPKEALDALALLTHDKEEPYMEYVCRAACDPVARAVKLADLTHNSDLSRLNTVTEEDRRRVEKYKIAKQLVQNTAAEDSPHEFMGEKYTHRSRISLHEPGNIFFTVYSSREKIAGIAIEAEPDNAYFHFSKEAARTLSEVLGGNQSLPEQLIHFLQNHTFCELKHIIKEHNLRSEPHFPDKSGRSEEEKQ